VTGLGAACGTTRCPAHSPPPHTDAWQTMLLVMVPLASSMDQTPHGSSALHCDALAGAGATIASDAAISEVTVNRDLVFIFSSYLEWNSKDVTPSY
jgi:hypothetical protein